MGAPNAGRKPRPANLKLLNGRHAGVDSGGRKVKTPPGFVRLPPEPPGFLVGEARAEWDRVVPELQRLNLTKLIDGAALTAYCLTWARMVDGQAILAAHATAENPGGLMFDGKQGRTRHPAVGVVEAAAKDLRAWCAEFGLSPSAEGRLSTAEVTDGDANPFGD